MVLATRSDSLGDFDCKLERGGRLKSRNLRLPPGARAFDERDELLFQRFLALDRHFVARDFSRFTPVDFAALFFVIEREVSVLLKNANLAHPLRTDPARRHIRHATVFEAKPRVG